MKIKLNPKQEQKLINAVNKEQSYKQQFLVAENQFREATKSRMDIFEMICDAHNVDVSMVDTKTMSIRNHELILEEIKKPITASERIKKSLKSKLNQNGHAKSKAKS
jgi:hypothetical protein